MRTSLLAALFALGGCLDAGGGAGADPDPIARIAQPSSAVATLDVPAGSQGTNDSRFFPIGIWQDTPRVPGENPPLYVGDVSGFIHESWPEIKRWGFNTIVPANSPEKTTLYLQTVDELGGLNLVSSGEGAPCNDIYGDFNAMLAAQDSVALHANDPGFLFYYPVDEPVLCQLRTARLIDRWLSLLDEAHGGIAAVHTDNPTFGYTSFQNVDKMMGLDSFTYDPYPWQGASSPVNRDPLNDVDVLLDRLYAVLPVDKPLYYVVQAFGEDFFRTPTNVEVRYESYQALASGARGLFYFIQRGDFVGGAITDWDFVPTAACGGTCSRPDYIALGAEIKSLIPEIQKLAPWLAEAHRDDVLNHCDAKSGDLYAPAPATASACDLTSFTTVTGQRLFMIVNKHPYSTTFPVTYSKNLGDTIWLYDVRADQIALAAASSATEYTYNVTLAAGEGRLFQVARSGDAQIRVARGAVQNPLMLGKAISIAATVKNVGPLPFTSQARVGVRLYPPDGGAPFVATASASSLASLAPGATASALVTIPTSTSPYAQVNRSGTWRVGLFLNDGTPLPGIEQPVTVMIEIDPLLVDTFDPPTFKRPADALRRWQRTAFATIREGALALSGQNLMVSSTGDAWTNYTMEFDLMIDRESDTPSAGWAVRASSTDKGGQNGYVLALSTGPNQLTRSTLVNGVLTTLATVPIAQPLAQGTWVHVRTVVAGSRVTTYLGAPGVLVDDFNDATFAHGRVGFYAAEGDGLGNGLWRMHVDNVDVHTTGLPPAVTPPTLLAVAPSGTGLKLVWVRSPQPDVASYRIFRGTSPQLTFTLVGTTELPTFTDPSPGTGTVYYTVAAVEHDDTMSLRSNALSGKALTPPGAVGALGVTPQSMRSSYLSWLPPNKATDHYDVFRADGPAPAVWTEDLRIGATQFTTFIDDAYDTFASDLALGPRAFQTHVYAVRAVDAAGNAGPITAASVTMPGSLVASDGFDAPRSGWAAGAAFHLGGSAVTTDLASCGATMLLNLPLNEAVVETTLQITAVNDPAQWAGIAIHRQTPRDNYLTSGYLLAYHANGDLVLSSTTGVLLSIATGILPTAAPRRLRVETQGARIAGFIDGVKYIDVTDPAPPANGDYGYFGLETCYTQTRFDDYNTFYRESFENDAGLAVLSGIHYLVQGALWLEGNVGLRYNLAADFTADVNMQIMNEWDGGLGWAGFVFRKASPLDLYWNSGYLVYLRANGQINLYRGGVDLASAATGLDPHAGLVHVRVQAFGNLIQVWANGVLRISVYDSTYSVGYLDLSTDSADARFNSLEIY